MAGFFFDGRVYQVPQAISKIDVILNIGAPLPDFGIGLIIGRNLKGPGYNQFPTTDPVAGFTKLSAVSSFYGPDSELAEAFKYWALHGGGTVFMMGSCATTKTSLTLGAGANKLVLTSKEFGAHTGDFVVELDINSNTITMLKITPVKNVRFLDEGIDATRPSVIVRDSGTLKVGDSVVLASRQGSGGGETYVPLTIRRIDTKDIRKEIVFEAPTGSPDLADFTPSNEAHIFQRDADNAETYSGVSSVESLVDQIANGSRLLDVATEGSPSVADLAEIDNKSIAELSTGANNVLALTAGQSPQPNIENWNSSGILANLSDHIERNRIRLITPIVTGGNETVFQPSLSTTSDLAAMRAKIVDLKTLAVAQRTNNRPVQIFMGALNGVVDVATAASNANPLEWTGDMNSQDMLFTVGNLDGVAPAASFAPAAMAMVSSSPVAHNLTRDQVNASTVEKEWSASGTDIAKLIDKGAIVVLPRPNGYFVAKGVNTLLSNQISWNLNGTTYLPMQRAMADFIDITLREGIDNTFIGTDGVTAGQIADYVVRTLDSIKAIKPTIIREYKLQAVTPSQNQGFMVDYSVKLAEETNFVGLTMEIIVG